MPNIDCKELKSTGFLPQVQKDHFSMRLRIAGGHITTEKLKKVYEIAEKYGRSYIHMTSRQSIEIPYIRLEDIDTVKNELTEAGLQTAAGGAKARTITACQGSAVCMSGLIDTTVLAKEFDEKYHGREVPHKFKIGITGCRNNCLKAEENDLGVKGAVKPQWEEAQCNYCGLCGRVCRSGAISVRKDEKKVIYDEKNCELCGRCVKACPTKAWNGINGFILYFGGTFGNRICIGKQLLPVISEKGELFRIVEISLEFFKKHGKPKERFSSTLDRVGWDLFANELRDDKI